MNHKVNLTVFEKFPALYSERLLFKAYEKEFTKDIFAIRSNDLVMKYMDSVKQKSIEDALKLIDTVQKDFTEQKGINWIILEKSTQQAIGYIGYWKIVMNHCRAEVGYALKPAFWGKGYMTEAISRIIDFAFDDLRVHSIEANINPANESSKKLLLKLGFKQEAYFRENYLFEDQFLDSAIFSLLESDWDKGTRKK